MLLAIPLMLASATEAVTPATPVAVAAPEKNPRVCETIPETGSRLSSHRICMLKSEWAEQRRNNKMLIDRSQVERSNPSGN